MLTWPVIMQQCLRCNCQFLVHSFPLGLDFKLRWARSFSLRRIGGHLGKKCLTIIWEFLRSVCSLCLFFYSFRDSRNWKWIFVINLVWQLCNMLLILWPCSHGEAGSISPSSDAGLALVDLLITIKCSSSDAADSTDSHIMQFSSILLPWPLTM